MYHRHKLLDLTEMPLTSSQTDLLNFFFFFNFFPCDFLSFLSLCLRIAPDVMTMRAVMGYMNEAVKKHTQISHLKNNTSGVK
jgi:hypothetical protein